MKVFSWFKFVSRAVHEEQEERIKYPLTEGRLCKSLTLTVWRKSLVISCKGFTVINSYGNLVYRVDNYMVHPNEVILMDASGNCVLSMRRSRKLGLVDSWFVYEGEMEKQSERSKSRESPVYCVRKPVNILDGKAKVQAYVYRVASDSDKRHAAFTVEGSYAHRTCKVLDEYNRAVAEIKRKEPNKHVSFGIEIFQLVVHPGFDPSFAMALVLLLDQMFS
ncbi:hypothetical protein VNO78_10335 [Psophocarpus tetragonolobus]|uniref:Protein LURP-one-related 17 n=1 Tax=Psophocarpus tetragonolobus TaxID=3891 RepID=A0AAN9XMN4_PSOTE